METTRFVLLIALGLVLTTIWQAWEEDYGSVVGNQPRPVLSDSSKPEEVPDDVPSLPMTAKESEINTLTLIDNEAAKSPPRGSLINVKTDVLDVDINTFGGTIESAALLNYPVTKYEVNHPVKLLKQNRKEFYIIQSGLLTDGGNVRDKVNKSIANHKTVYKTDDKQQNILDDNDSLTVQLNWQAASGLQVKKSYTFYRGSYEIDVRHRVINGSDSRWSGRAYSQINRTDPVDKGSRLLYTYTGAVLSSPNKRYQKIDFDDIREETLSVGIRNGWVAMLQHYFFTALIPGSKEDIYRYYTLNPDKESYVIGAASSIKEVEVGEEKEFYQRLYIGPKLQKTLSEIAEGLELTVDYGIFWFIANPLYWVLDYIHRYTKNWGFAIILVTLLLKLLFYRLSAAGYRSMANMRRVQPRLVSIRERYKEDRTCLNKAMMDLYKEENINPLGGCFPILIQIPVFISLYWVLLETVELRQAEFMLWIHDLSSPDPYFVLPLLMGITMFVQQKLNPAPMDPVQEKVMTILPVVFTVFFAFFPSGLVLYWVVNNILSIAQQWFITRSIEAA